MTDATANSQGVPGVPETLPITLDQYDILVQRGTFANTYGQVELVRGRIVRMNPQGPEHADPIDFLAEWSIESVRRRFTVRIQMPLRFPDQASCPEPDIAWVTRGRYSRRHPGPDEIQLVIEVSLTSGPFDRTEKAELYAAGGVPEYWQVDLPSRTVTAYRGPRDGVYRDVRPYEASQTIHPTCLPDGSLLIANLFGG